MTEKKFDKIPPIKRPEALSRSLRAYLELVTNQDTIEAYQTSREVQLANNDTAMGLVRSRQENLEQIESEIMHGRHVLWEEVFGVSIGLNYLGAGDIATVGGIISHYWEDKPKKGSLFKKFLDNQSFELTKVADPRLTLAVMGSPVPLTNAQLIRFAWLKLSNELISKDGGILSEFEQPLDPNGADGLLVILRTHPTLAPLFKKVYALNSPLRSSRY